MKVRSCELWNQNPAGGVSLIPNSRYYIENGGCEAGHRREDGNPSYDTVCEGAARRAQHNGGAEAVELCRRQRCRGKRERRASAIFAAAC